MRFLILLLLVFNSCQGSPSTSKQSHRNEINSDKEKANTSVVKPPFNVSGELENLLIVWFDKEGLHTAKNRTEIPESARKQVRVDSLAIPPEQKLDPDWVYVADVSSQNADQSYTVRKMKRSAFEKLVDASTGYKPPGPSDTAPSNQLANVIIYGASWCGACRSTAKFLKQHNVVFIEKDIEKDPSAQKEMQTKMQKAGLMPSGIPVIDFRGTMVQGFNQPKLEQLIQQPTKLTI